MTRREDSIYELAFRPDPKRIAAEFLRIRGVSYTDLISGDHAAELLAEWTLVMTEWQRNWDIHRQELEQIKLQTNPLIISKKKEE